MRLHLRLGKPSLHLDLPEMLHTVPSLHLPISVTPGGYSVLVCLQDFELTRCEIDVAHCRSRAGRLLTHL